MIVKANGLFAALLQTPDLEADDHDDEGEHHDGGVATLQHQLVALVAGRHHAVYQRTWRRGH